MAYPHPSNINFLLPLGALLLNLFPLAILFLFPNEADIDLDCYNPSTPQINENIEKILSSSKMASQPSQQMISTTHDYHSDSDSESETFRINERINEAMELELDSETTTTGKFCDNSKMKNMANEKEMISTEAGKKQKMSSEFDQKNNPTNMKVSAALFKTKNSLKLTRPKKRRISENDKLIDAIVDEGPNRNKEGKSESNQVDPDADEITLSRSKLSETKTTYARRKRPFIQTPGSSIHSPAPYDTPSYAPSPYSLPSPLTPINKFNHFPKGINDINQIDVRYEFSVNTQYCTYRLQYRIAMSLHRFSNVYFSSTVVDNSLDIEEILVSDSPEAEIKSIKSLKDVRKVGSFSTSNASPVKSGAKPNESQMPLQRQYSSHENTLSSTNVFTIEKPNSTSKGTDRKIDALSRNKNRASVPKGPDATDGIINSNSKMDNVIKSPIQTRSRYEVEYK